MKKSLILPPTIFILIVVAVVAFAFRYQLFGNHDELNDASSASWLPSEAHSIYARNHGASEVYEFNISEQGFLEWAKKKGLEISPIVGESIRMNRYTQRDSAEKEKIDCFSGYGPKLTPEAANVVQECINESAGIHVATKGYQGEKLGENYGGYRVVYDTEQGRAYYSWSTH